MLKSPLRYPGGKSRALRSITALLPPTFAAYREPFVGGGSLFIHLRQLYPHLAIWINDLNPEVYYFWTYAQRDAQQLAAAIAAIKSDATDGRQLFNKLVQISGEQLPDFDRAVRFFVLNRITFSGIVESGGYSQLAFKSRFTDSAIQRVAQLGPLLTGIKITHSDYRDVLTDGGPDVFTFLDPPYFSATKSKLYGKKGVLHTAFDHHAFATAMQHCSHSWLVTYDDAPAIRDNFAFANVRPWELQYGMNNYKQGKANKGRELFLSNYPLPPLPTHLPITNMADAQLALV